MGIKVNLRGVNTMWMNVFERAKDQKNDDGSITKGQYETTIALPEDHPQIDALYDAALEVVAEALGQDAAEKWMKKNYGEGNHSDKCAVRDLAERDSEIEGFESGLYFRAKAPKQPAIFTSKKGEQQTEPDFDVNGEQIEGKQVYGGCIANVSVEVWWSKNYKVLGIQLLGIKFKDDGKAFGGGSALKASADDLEDDEDEAPRPRRRRD